MTKMSTLLAALLFAAVSVAHAETPNGAASVQDNMTDNKSDGHATKGLTNAEQHITAAHGKDEKVERKAEKTEHAARPDRPTRPERLERPGR